MNLQFLKHQMALGEHKRKEQRPNESGKKMALP